MVTQNKLLNMRPTESVAFTRLYCNVNFIKTGSYFGGSVKAQEGNIRGLQRKPEKTQIKSELYIQHLSLIHI